MKLLKYKSIYLEDWNPERTQITLYKADLVWRATINLDEVVVEVSKGNRPLRVTKVIKLKPSNVGRANEVSAKTKAKKWVDDSVKKLKNNGYTEQQGSTVGSESTTKSPKPMLAKKIQDMNSDEFPNIVFLQRKLDGNRCLINTKDGTLWSRGQKQIIIPHLTEIIKNYKIVGTDWLDGELYAHNQTLQTITGTIRQKSTDAKGFLQFHMYDCISNKGYGDRLEIIENFYDKLKPEDKKFIHIVETYIVDIDDVSDYVDHFIEEGYEGGMIRLDNMPYVEARSESLIKVKKFEDSDFEIIGFVQEGGDIRKEPTLGTFVLKAPNGKPFRAAPKMSDVEKKEIWDNQEEYLGELAITQHIGYTPKGIPRNANVKAVRAD